MALSLGQQNGGYFRLGGCAGLLENRPWAGGSWTRTHQGQQPLPLEAQASLVALRASSSSGHPGVLLREHEAPGPGPAPCVSRDAKFSTPRSAMVSRGQWQRGAQTGRGTLTPLQELSRGGGKARSRPG